MKTVLVLGAKGQLGRSLQAIAPAHPGFQFLFWDKEEFNITHYSDWDTLFYVQKKYKIDWIVNCAAYTNVEKAETEREECEELNVKAVRMMSDFSHQFGFKVLHVSTDFVFDGEHFLPYAEDDPIRPLSWYGQTKATGDYQVLLRSMEAVVLRTSWLYSEYGNNFVKTMLRLGAEREELKVVCDQVGTPTYAGDLAFAIMEILESDLRGELKAGLYHYSNEGVCSWYDFAHEVIRQAGLPAKVLPIETGEYPAVASRPWYSVLNKKKIKQAYGLQIPHWTDSLRTCLANMGIINN